MRAPKGQGRKRVFSLLLCLFVCLAVLAGAGVKSLGTFVSEPAVIAELPADLQFDRLVVHKETRLLTAYAKGEALRRYRIALGWAPEGHKQMEGDGKTPEGIYFVDGKNPNSRYYKNLGVSYPNDEDRAAATALDVSPGGDIKIHGLPEGQGHLGETHWLRDWTAGCIAVSNEEIDELYAHTPVGTLIEIKP